MSTDNLPAAKLPEPEVEARIVAGVYRDGVIHPAAPLELPAESPVLIVAVEATPEAPAPLALPLAAPTPSAAAPPRLFARGGAWLNEHRESLELGRPALLLLAAGLALLAQWRFLGVGGYDRGALLAALLAAPLLALALHGLAPASPGPETPREEPAVAAPRLTRVRIIALAASALVAAGVLIGLAGAPSNGDYALLAAGWAAAIGLGVAAFAPRMAWRRPTRAALLAAAPLASLGLAALALRAWQIGTIPATMGGDEGSQGLEAIMVLRGEIANPFTTRWLGVPTMSFFFNAPSIALLGNTALALRLPWALVGAATVPLAYLLIARLQGRLIGLLSAGFLAGFHYHIHFSRLGSNQVADAFFVALALLLLYRGYDRRDPLAWALCGATVGLAQYFYAGARFTAVIVAVTVALFLLHDGRRLWREQRWGLVALAWVGLLTAGPMIQYAFRFPDEFNARINEVGIFQSGWLEREQDIRGQGALPILIDQFWRAALLYNAYPDRTVWYGSPVPLFGVVEGGLFILGLGYGLLRLGDRRLFPMAAWWGGAVIMGGMLTESPPSLQRLTATAVPAAFFLSLGLALVLRGLWALLGRGEDRGLRATMGAIILALALLSARYYFMDYTPRRIYGGQNAVVATSLAEYVNSRLSPETRVVFFGPPRMYYGFGTIPYLTGRLQGVDVFEPLQAPIGPELAVPGSDVAFVFLPERLGELAMVEQSFPGGALEEIPAPTSSDPLYIVYRPPR